MVSLNIPILAIVTLLTASPLTATSIRHMQEEEQFQLALFLAMDKHEYCLNELTDIDVRLMNSGEIPLFLFSRLLWGEGAGFETRVLDALGRRLHPTKLQHARIVPQWLDENTNYAKLMPGVFLGVKSSFAVEEFFNKPGEYSFAVVYRSPVLGALAPVSPVWSKENGPIESEELQVRVSECSPQEAN